MLYPQLCLVVDFFLNKLHLIVNYLTNLWFVKIFIHKSLPKFDIKYYICVTHLI